LLQLLKLILRIWHSGCTTCPFISSLYSFRQFVLVYSEGIEL